MMTTIELGCGKSKHDRATGIDMDPDSDADVLSDLNDGIPIRSGAADEVIAHHSIEHLSDVGFIISEIHRILRADGTLWVKVPYCRSFDAFADPTHQHFFTEKTFSFFTDKFEIKNMRLRPVTTWMGKLAYVFPPCLLKRAFFDVYNEIDVKLKKR